MTKKGIEFMIPDELIINKIYLIRNKKVMLDRDLADLYGVETKVLKQTVRRNIKRFPTDFMFEMSFEELNDWRSQIVTSNSDKMGLRYPPFCFTEHGEVMLASVLNSERAININVQIVRIFNKMREMLVSNKDILSRLQKAEHKLAEGDDKILLIFEYLKQLEQSKQQEIDQLNRKRVGFKRKEEQ
jgi:phage regulator Rha-like protein